MINDRKFIGVYTDMCAFFDKSTADTEKIKRGFISNMEIWRGCGVNLVTVGLQSPCPFGEYYKKAREQNKGLYISSDSSAINHDGSLNFDFLDNAEKIIVSANSAKLTVLVNILSPMREYIFDDEYAVINGIFNAVEWLAEKNFTDILVNITDISHTFYKSSVLNQNKINKILKSVRDKTTGKLILSAGIKTFANFNENDIREYIELSDFIPIYAINPKSIYTTKNMIEKIYFFKKIAANIPIIMVKGDDLNDKYNSYGKINLTEALDNNISWCYYDLNGFVILNNRSINWDINSSPEKKRFFETVKNI